MSQSGSERPHLAGVVEDRWNPCSPRRWAGGAGDTSSSRTSGTADPGSSGSSRGSLYAPAGTRPPASDAALQRRGWRNFFTAEALDVPVTVTVAGERHRRRTDRSGNVDARLPALRPGTRLARGDHRTADLRRRRRRGCSWSTTSRLRHRQRHRRHGAPHAAAAAAAGGVQHVRAAGGGAAAGRRHGRAVRRAAGRPSRRAHGLRLDRCVEHAPARCGGSWPATASPTGRCC